MAKLKIRYLIAKPAAGGRVKYFWQPSTRLREIGWTAKGPWFDLDTAVREARAENDRLDAWRQGEGPGPTDPNPDIPNAPSLGRSPLPGTFDHLVATYKQSRFYLHCAASTRYSYDENLDILSQWCGDAQVGSLTTKRIEDFYTTLAAATPSKAHHLVGMLSIVLGCARRLYPPEHPGYLEHNPARELRREGQPGGGLLIPREAVGLMVEAADRMGRHSIGDAILLNEWIGQRRGDVLDLPRSIYRNGTVTLTQRKTGARVQLPIHIVPHIAARLEAAIRRAEANDVASTFLIVSEETGTRYESSNFKKWYARIRDAATAKWPALPKTWEDQDWLETDPADWVPLKAFTFKDLRHTAVTRLAEANVSVPLIASITGHTITRVQQIIDRYMVRTTAMAETAFRMRLDHERNIDNIYEFRQ